MSAITYRMGNSLYLNITNRCTNKCDFCIRYKAKLFDSKHELWLKKEPTAQEVIKAIGDPKKYDEVVFCGYGEPLIRLDEVIEISKWVKDNGGKVRINTNGHGNLINKKNILPELKGLVDSMSVSLDAENKETYDSICHPDFGAKAFGAIIDFIKEAKNVVPEVEATVVDLPEVDKKAAQKIADDLGVSFRVRTYYEQDYKK
jgi:TatD DNase family protein